MKTHTHLWRILSVVTLTLPDADGYFQQSVAWACRTCPEELTLNGLWHHQTRARSPEEWREVQQQERGQGTALAVASLKEEHIKVKVRVGRDA